MTKDMTKGSPMRLILGFSIPLLFGFLFQQFYSLVDTVIVGRFLGTENLAAVGSTGSVNFLIIGFCMGICSGFSIPISHKFGAGDYSGMRRVVANCIWLSIAFAAVLTVLTTILCRPILVMMKTPENILEGAYTYIWIIFLGIPFTILYNYLSSILRSVGDSRTPFIFLALSAVLNIFLDLFCIVVLKLGCAGAAIATISAQAISGILCLIFIIRKMKLLWLKKENRAIKGDAVKELLAMGMPTGLQFSITAIGSMVMQSANNGLGSTYVSAFTAAMKIKQFTMCPFDAIATSASVFCSQNLGAGQSDRIKKGLRCGITVGVGYGIAAGILLIFAGRTLSMLFVGKSAVAVLDASAKYLRCMGFFYWSLGILNVARMVTQGLGYSGRAVFSGVTEMIARTVVSLGFVGAFAIILVFVLLIIEGYSIASRCQDKFGCLVAIGITTQIAIQAIFNFCVVSNLVPNTGISLPFFSYGGTAIVMQLMEMGIMLNISRKRYYPKEENTDDNSSDDRNVA